MEHQREDGGFLGQPAWLWSGAALVLGLAASCTAAWIQYKGMVRDERTMYERRVERSFDAVEAQLHSCGLLVRSVQSLFLSSDRVTPLEFDSIYLNLRPRQLFPTLQAIAYADRVPGADGRDHFPTRLVAPLAGNERVRGLDVVSQPASLRALLASRDSDDPAMSAAFTLIQRQGLPGNNRDGIIIRLPAYSPGLPPRTLAERRARFTGSIAVSFQVRSLIEQALPREAREVMDVRVIDVTDRQPQSLFAASMRQHHALGEPHQFLDLLGQVQAAQGFKRTNRGLGGCQRARRVRRNAFDVMVAGAGGDDRGIAFGRWQHGRGFAAAPGGGGLGFFHVRFLGRLLCLRFHHKKRSDA